MSRDVLGEKDYEVTEEYGAIKNWKTRNQYDEKNVKKRKE